MPLMRYRVHFDRHWLLGRWGQVNAFMERHGGRTAEPWGECQSWFLPYHGDAHALGAFLQAQLIQGTKMSPLPDTVFHIEALP